MNDEPGSPDPELETDDQPGLAPGRLLHVTLLVIVALPVAAWLFRPYSAPQEAVPTGQEVGETAADFTLELFDGKEFTLSSHLAEDGRPVVLNFWASWCVPCRVEMPAIDTMARQRPDILFLGIAVQDTATAARAVADEIGVGYPLGHDSDGTILEKYPILGLPATWFITADGIVTEQWFGQLDETILQELIDRHA